MSLTATQPRLSHDGVRAAARRLDVVWPTLVTALVYAIFLGALLASAHGNPATLISFGHRFLHSTRPPAGTPIVSGPGYDGQGYWLQATDPLFLHASTIARIATTQPAYSLQRMAYPALAWLLAAGHDGALPWTMLIVNLLAVLGLTAGVSVYARRCGRNPGWALVAGLCPGLLVATSRDLTDVLATVCMLGGLMCVSRRRTWWAALLLMVAVLSREPMTLAVVAVAAELGWRCLRARRSWTQVRSLVRETWPALVLPAAAYVGWKLYADTLPLPVIHGVAGSIADAPILPPFNGLRLAAQSALTTGGPGAIFTLVYLGLTAAGILASLAVLRRGLSAASVMAALYAVLVLPLLVFGDQIALTRYTMPMFLALLLAGLERRSRSALVISATATATIVLLPLLGA
jgi:hypothetical protein